MNSRLNDRRRNAFEEQSVRWLIIKTIYELFIEKDTLDVWVNGHRVATTVSIFLRVFSKLYCKINRHVSDIQAFTVNVFLNVHIFSGGLPVRASVLYGFFVRHICTLINGNSSFCCLGTMAMLS